MMHKLQKQVFKVDYYNEAGVSQFHDKALHLFYQDLSPEMERILNKHSEPQKFIRIDNLTINLGVTYETELRTQWLSRFKEEFEKELLKRIDLIRNGLGLDGESIDHGNENDLSVLLYYLRSGTLPWYATTSNINIHALFNKLLISQPSEINSKLRSENTKEKIILRIVIQFTDDHIEKLIKVLQPAESDFIILSASEIRKSQQRDHVVKAGNKEFRNSIWEFILSYLLYEKGSYFNTREFIHSLLRKMANRFNISSLSLIQEIYKSINRLKLEPVRYRFGNLLMDIYQSDTSIAGNQAEDEINYSQIIDYLFQRGDGKQKSSGNSLDIYELIMKWMNDSPFHFRQFLIKNGDEKVLQHLIISFQEEDVQRLVRIISPSEATFVISFSDEISFLQAKQHWAGLGNSQFKIDLWVILLFVILNERKSLFSQKLFVLNALEKLSRHYNLDSTYFIDQVLALFNEQQKLFTSTYLSDLFIEIRKDFLVKTVKKVYSEYEKTKYYLEFIEKGIIKNAEEVNGNIHDYYVVTWKDKNEIIDLLVSKNPELLINWITQKLTSESRVIKFSEGLSINLLLEIIKLMPSSGKIRSKEFVKIFMDIIKTFTTDLAFAEIELCQFAFVFLVLHNREGNLEESFLSSIINHMAKKMQIKEEKLVEAFLEKLSTARGGIRKETKMFLSQEFGINQYARINHGQQKSAVENETSYFDIQKKQNPKVPGSNKSVEEASGIESSAELNDWLNLKLTSIRANDSGRIRHYLRVFFDKQNEKNWEGSSISTNHILEILAGISLTDSPFLVGYLKDLELLLNELNSVFNGISFNWIRERILFFWANEKSFQQQALSEFLINEISIRTRRSEIEIKTLLFELARKIHRRLGSTLILDLVSDDVNRINKRKETERILVPEKEKSKQKIKQTGNSETDESQTIYIANAGLVLLNPFIPVLFEKAGLISNRTFINEEMQKYAVHLLQYCVNNCEENPEYVMTLPKILCGLEPDEPIENEAQIKEEEKAIVESLLTNIISQWNILGNTKIDGLQQTFIERNGALRARENSWELEVEKRPFDMLLDKIPWTYSLIKYPWMPKPINTIWR